MESSKISPRQYKFQQPQKHQSTTSLGGNKASVVSEQPSPNIFNQTSNPARFDTVLKKQLTHKSVGMESVGSERTKKSRTRAKK